MKKKVLIVLLVSALVLTGLAAKDTSALKVGAQFGWGFDLIKSTAKTTVGSSTTKTTTQYKNNGFDMALTGEYDFNNKTGVRLTAGMMIMGKPYYKYKDGEYKAAAVDQNSGVTGDFSLDFVYTHAFDKNLGISVLSGAEMMIGYVYKTGNADSDKKAKNLALGVNIGGEFSYKASKNLYITGGVSGALFFVNNAEILKNSKNSIVVGSTTLADAKYSTISLLLRPYIGAQYAF